MKAFIAELDEHQKMIGRLANVAQVIEAAGELLVKTLSLGGKLLLCGNGGSAADCQHIAAELVVRYAKERKALAAIALTTDTSILTAHANDIGFDSVFSRQVEALGKAGDCLIAVSTSGESQNVIAAVIAAQKYGLSSIALTGRSGGELSQQAQVSVIVPSDVTARIQEAHILIGHWWCGYIEEAVHDGRA
ncbi:MAG: SIS domain-containing protein [Methylococcaceae bacterium]